MGVNVGRWGYPATPSPRMPDCRGGVFAVFAKIPPPSTDTTINAAWMVFVAAWRAASRLKRSALRLEHAAPGLDCAPAVGVGRGALRPLPPINDAVLVRADIRGWAGNSRPAPTAPPLPRAQWPISKIDRHVILFCKPIKTTRHAASLRSSRNGIE